MATYAIGDVQGCYEELQRLLERIRFDPAGDRLWFVGDLVNRGPKSLEVLRFVRALGNAAIAILGNHDLHLLCLFEGFAKRRTDDTLDALLAAPDAPELVAWLRRRPLMHVEGDYAMVHAGLLPQWSIDKSRVLGQEVESALQGSAYREFLAQLYGSRPAEWSDSLTGWDRLRVIVNAMTRMRYCTRGGTMDFRAKGAVAPAGYQPWFETRPADERATIVCGHWSALGLRISERLLALDSGCVWGGSLAVIRLEDRSVTEFPCRGYRPVDA